MRTGEKGILLVIAVLVVGGALWSFQRQSEAPPEDREIPFYSTASAELRQAAGAIYRRENCKSCHTLWTVRDIMQSVPAPALDGIGSLHDEQWFFEYFSAGNPQLILPSRLKAEYQMPSYAHLPDDERRTLAAYMASLKVKDWYLDEARKARCRKLTGEEECP
jgi:mono/diheme cytochrome c family protein